MTLPAVIRIFFAIDLPSATKAQLGKFISKLKKNSHQQGIRWTKPENLHITLQFLPEVRTEHLENLIKNVRFKLIEQFQAFNLNFGEVHLFPNPYRPRVIVLDVLSDERLTTLAEAIGQGIMETAYEIDDRPFRAHLTIGRIKHPHTINLNFLNTLQVPPFNPLTIQEVSLFRSQPQEQGSYYEIIELIKL